MNKFIIEFFIVLSNLSLLLDANPVKYFDIGRRIDMHGNTELHVAAGEGNYNKVIDYFLHGENMDIENFYGDTPLCESAFYGREDIAKFLIRIGANVNHHGSLLKKTPINRAAMNGKSDMVRILFSRGADVNLADHIGWTPIFAASRYGHESVVRQLLQYGAKVHVRDKTGRTLLSVAEKSGNINIINMIAEAIDQQSFLETTTYPCHLKEVDNNTWMCYRE